MDKKIKFGVLISLFLLMSPSFVSASIKFAVEKDDMFSIYPEYQYVNGKVMRYFERCNPCTVYLVIDDEPAFYESLVLNVRGSVGGVRQHTNVYFYNQGSGRWDGLLISSEGRQRVINAGCSISFSGGQYVLTESHDSCCKKLGYEGWFSDTGWNECFTTQKFDPNIDMKLDGQLIWERKNGVEPKTTTNIYDTVNQRCEYDINEFRKDVGAYHYECFVPIVSYSDVNGGGFEIELEPAVKEYTPCGERYCLDKTPEWCEKNNDPVSVCTGEWKVENGQCVFECYENPTTTTTTIIPNPIFCEDQTWIMGSDGICRPPEPNWFQKNKWLLIGVIIAVTIIIIIIVLKR